MGAGEPLNEARSEAFDYAADPMAIVADDGALLATNAEWRRAASAASGATAPHFLASLHGADRADATAAFARALGGSATTVEVRFAGQEPSTANDAWYALRLSSGPRRDRVFVVARDVTEGRLRAARMRVLSRLLEATPVVLTATDREGAVTLSDGKGLVALGFAPGEVHGLNLRELYADTDLAEPIRRAFLGEDVSARCNFANGSTFDHWFSPIYDSQDKVDGVIGIAVDATAQYAAEQELRDKVALIERQTATIRSLATPIIQVWDGVLCLPVVGMVDAERASAMMSALLDAVCTRQARFAILDLTGVEVVDTATTQHLLQLFKAVKVLGVRSFMSGIHPAVAQSIVSLGVELEDVQTTLDLKAALKLCISADVGAPRARAQHGASVTRAARHR